MRILRLFGLAFSMSLRATFAYRTNLFFDVLLSVLTLFGAVGAVQLVFTQTDSLAGWSNAETLILVGTFQMMGGIRSAFVDPNLSWFVERIRDGKLDLYLLQPAPSLFLASLGTYAPLALTQVVLGAGVIGFGLTLVGAVPTLAGVAAWLLLIVVGAVVVWALGVLIACLAFWAPRLQLDILYGSAWELARYPVDIYRRPMRFALTYVFPMAVITTLPTRALMDGPDLRTMALAIGAGGLAAALAIGLWALGLRRYTGATS